jgi:ribosomal protein S18 acetylase RimI-like enzyme
MARNGRRRESTVDEQRAVLHLRRAVAGDEARVREIAAQIWEGHDYTGEAFAAWVSEPGGELVVAQRGDTVVGYAHRKTLVPGYVWFEGIRVDPVYEGGGVAKAITRYLVEAARADGASAIGLSTYIDNAASMHIVERMGFSRVASFVFFEARPDAAVRSLAKRSARCEAIPLPEAIRFVTESRFLSAAAGRVPHGWTFFPFARDPHRALSEGRELLGIRRAGELIALAVVARSLQHDGELAIDFLDGACDGLTELVKHLLFLARPEDVVQAMLPQAGDVHTPALEVFVELGIPSWNDLSPDVFVYERIESR